jgi:hypothetical protein
MTFHVPVADVSGYVFAKRKFVGVTSDVLWDVRRDFWILIKKLIT